ncbi:hypothetical protein swp_3886 [Shewanella piezotolerans WP3]|uniref:Uncharacterized protein n=1 Tax=Shewanella piezotolerans (strain WP3 / JCM 13877) TaxID=225849 RepID=B8CQU7_SHEPW|nr:hypothetical protein swp_3886 [Shewanella piezotolerans WP3]
MAANCSNTLIKQVEQRTSGQSSAKVSDCIR